MEQERTIVCQLQSVPQFSLDIQVKEKMNIKVDSGAQVTMIGPVKIKTSNHLFTEEFHVATIQRDCKGLTFLFTKEN